MSALARRRLVKEPLGALILRGPFNVLDHEHFKWCFGWLQL